ncbi:Rad52/22 family double-strand break repair protein [Fragilaria crotonensis]|nr:Rad52/22 family double-strand break repair protein [Fragilaria crotonensis]
MDAMSSEELDDSEDFLKAVIESYKPPGTASGITNNVHHPQHLLAPCEETEWVRNHDGSILLDHNGIPLSVARLLATKPLRHELSSRPGPGNRKLTYLSGEAVTRTLNDAFGFDGWNLEILSTTREHMAESKDGKVAVAYTARVRVTHRKSGTYKEDCGAGDAIDRTAGTAIANALKASITDAMKRAARHFGDKLGNSLYQGTFSINKAPNTLQQALDQYAIDRANTKFGVPTNQAWPSLRESSTVVVKTAASPPIVKVHPIKETVPVQNVYRKVDPCKLVAPIPNAGPPSQNAYQTKAAIPPQVRQESRNHDNVAILPVPNSAVASGPVHVKPTSLRTPVHAMPSKLVTLQPTPATGMSSIPAVTPGTMQPPQTPGQRLLESNLFGLKAGQGSQSFLSNLENQQPFSTDDVNRPGTSTGLHQQQTHAQSSGSGPFAGKKRDSDAVQSHDDAPIKRPTVTPIHRVSNPYA